MPWFVIRSHKIDWNIDRGPSDPIVRPTPTGSRGCIEGESLSAVAAACGLAQIESKWLTNLYYDRNLTEQAVVDQMFEDEVDLYAYTFEPVEAPPRGMAVVRNLIGLTIPTVVDIREKFPR